LSAAASATFLLVAPAAAPRALRFFADLTGRAPAAGAAESAAGVVRACCGSICHAQCTCRKTPNSSHASE
jgi:hypothetical protein